VIPTSTDFYARVLAHADDARRLPLPDQAGWEIFPFEGDSLRVKVLDPLTLPEPPRNGEDGTDCWRCTHPDDDVVWSNERWTMSRATGARLPFEAMLMPRAHLDLTDLDDAMAAELGALSVRVARAVEALDSIGRVHVNTFDEAAAVMAMAVDALADLGTPV
jgi:hypothetical protein